MPRDAPPSSAEVTTSLTCRDSVEVNTFTSSGMMAPASVPQEMIVASFHHCEASPPRTGMITEETTYVSAIETTEVIQTRSERRFIVHLVGFAVFGVGDEAIYKVGCRAGDEHDYAHHEDPHEQLDLHSRIFHSEENKSD